MQIIVVGLDISKHVFQIHAVDGAGAVVRNYLRCDCSSCALGADSHNDRLLNILIGRRSRPAAWQFRLNEQRNHNPEVEGSSPPPATNNFNVLRHSRKSLSHVLVTSFREPFDVQKIFFRAAVFG